MRPAARTRIQRRRRRQLTGLTILLGSLLVASGGLGLVLQRLPSPALWLALTGLQVGAGLIYLLHYPYAPLLVEHGHAEPLAVNRMLTLLGLQVGVLTTLALTVLTWIMLLTRIAMVEQLLGDLALLTLVVGTYTDLRWRIVPNKIVLPGLVIALVGLPFTADWSSRLWAVGFVALVYTLRSLLLLRPTGMGDAKLLLLLALTLGLPTLLASLGVMCVLTLVFYGVQIGRGRLTRHDPIPLVPFIALGVGIVALGPVVSSAL